MPFYSHYSAYCLVYIGLPQKKFCSATKCLKGVCNKNVWEMRVGNVHLGVNARD